jgi:hypothetical protein
MGGKPCIRGMRVTVGTLVGLVASGYGFKQTITPTWMRMIFGRLLPMPHGVLRRWSFRSRPDEAARRHEPHAALGRCLMGCWRR